jgi:hypothetical protein
MSKVLKERAARGAELLDKMYPGWHNNIDIFTLDIAYGEQCVIGQLFGSFNKHLKRLDHVIPEDKEHKFGFNMRRPCKDKTWAKLNKAWIKEILKRRRLTADIEIVRDEVVIENVRPMLAV